MMNIDDRIEQIVQEFPSISQEELEDQLRKEGYGILN